MTTPAHKELNSIIRRMEELRQMLTNPANLDLAVRPELQREYRELEAQLSELAPNVELIYVPDVQLLLWKENGRIRAGMSGPRAADKFDRIREFVKITMHNAENNKPYIHNPLNNIL
jgi:protein subunit release factor A